MGARDWLSAPRQFARLAFRYASSEIVDKLNKEINAGLVDPGTRQRLADLGCLIFGGSPADFAKFVAGEIERWTKVVHAAGLKGGVSAGAALVWR